MISHLFIQGTEHIVIVKLYAKINDQPSTLQEIANRFISNPYTEDLEYIEFLLKQLVKANVITYRKINKEIHYWKLT